MEIAQNLNNSLGTINNNIEQKQNGFLQSGLWKLIDKGLNLGIRILLPNVIEDHVINIKDAILNNGFKSGAKTAISSAIDLGKSALGIVTGKFDNISQAHNAIRNGGLIDTLSNGLTYATNKAVNANLISEDIGRVITKGKDVILNTIESNIENNFTGQLNTLELLGKYEKQWTNYFNLKDFDGMEREYRKIKTALKEIMPMENTILEAKRIENLHLLIRNNGKNFNLSQEQMLLANKLVN